MSEDVGFRKFARELGGSIPKGLKRISGGIRTIRRNIREDLICRRILVTTLLYAAGFMAMFVSYPLGVVIIGLGIVYHVFTAWTLKKVE